MFYLIKNKIFIYIYLCNIYNFISLIFNLLIYYYYYYHSLLLLFLIIIYLNFSIADLTNDFGIKPVNDIDWISPALNGVGGL